MSSWDRLTRPPDMRLRLRILAILWVIIGALGACGSGILLVPSLKAAHGGGVTGTVTLTEPLSCDRYEPPRQRCGWFGDFRSADGRTIRRHMELTGGLPPGAVAGDTVPARDVGSLAAVHRVGDTRSWRLPAGVFAAFLGAFLAGIVVLRPWRRRGRPDPAPAVVADHLR